VSDEEKLVFLAVVLVVAGVLTLYFQSVLSNHYGVVEVRFLDNCSGYIVSDKFYTCCCETIRVFCCKTRPPPLKEETEFHYGCDGNCYSEDVLREHNCSLMLVRHFNYDVVPEWVYLLSPLGMAFICLGFATIVYLGCVYHREV